MSSDIRRQLESSFGDQYSVERELGGGGMARVFVATDNALGRRVVIKVFSPELAASVSPKRFEREIRFAAALQQANIVPVLSAGEAAGLPLYTMPFVEGLSLRERLERDGTPPLAETVGILRDVARALAYAHERGVVHRDIKPENVLLSGDAAVVTDFGIAKALANARLSEEAKGSAASTVTRAGTAVGTPGYMAPEQISGDPDMDHRADLYSYGCLAYELLAGKPPFVARSVHALFAAHLSEQPAPVAQIRPECPPSLARLVTRCLEKDPAARPQSAREILGALETISTTATPFERFRQRVTRRQRIGAIAVLLVALSGSAMLVARSRVAGGSQIQSLAVLPLENLSGDSAQEYFADGMTETLITDLARSARLKRVTSRGSVIRYKGTQQSLTEIARELNVDAVITGSVMRSGDQVSISAQLIDPGTQDVLWANRYARDLRDVLALQNEIVSAILGELKAQIAPGDRTRLTSARAVNPEAYEVYLRGRSHWFRMTRVNLETAMKYFQLALEKDPNYALAHAGIAATWAARAQVGIERAHQAYPEVKAASLRALELDDGLSEARTTLAAVYMMYEHNWTEAERELRRALELNPNDAQAHAFYGLLLAWTGRLPQGRAQIERALALDPLNTFWQWQLGLHLIYARQYDEAIGQFRRVLEVEPNNPDANVFLVHALHVKGMREEALAFRKQRAIRAGSQALVDALERGYAASGYRGAWREAANLRVAEARQRFVNPSAPAGLYAQAGDWDEALAWLERAYQERTGQIVFIKVDPLWDPVRADPRFQVLLRKLDFPQ